MQSAFQKPHLGWRTISQHVKGVGSNYDPSTKGVGLQIYASHTNQNNPPYTKRISVKQNHFDTTKYGLLIAPEQNPLTDQTGITRLLTK